MKKILFIADAYHKKTKSCDFLTDYLKEFYEVEVLYCEAGEIKHGFDYSKISDEYFAVIFWQNAPRKKVFDKIKHPNIIFFPMYDAVKDWKCRFGKWNTFKNTKIVCFSSTLHKKLKKWGFNSFYVQYFIEPKEFTPGAANEIFFWQRRTKDNFVMLKKLLGDSLDVMLNSFQHRKSGRPCDPEINSGRRNLYKVHLHAAVDPDEKFLEPSEADKEKYQMTFSNWFDSKDEMNTYIMKKAIYIAPRRYEGIGMSFLEAMAMGRVVIANNKPTMNEYIKHGETGFLCDFSNPKPLKLENIEQIQKNTYEFAKKGYQNWIKDRKQIVSFIEITNGKKVYDLVLGLGNFCQTSYQLRNNDLQFKSYPFDWIRNGSIGSIIELFKTDFKDFFNKEDLQFEKVEDWPHNSFNNIKTGFSFIHEFTPETIDKEFDSQKEKLQRRISRMLKDLKNSKNTLLVYRNDKADSDEIIKMYEYFKQTYTQSKIDLLWITADRNEKEIVKEIISENILKVTFDADKYLGTATFHNGCEGYDEKFKELFKNIYFDTSKLTFREKAITFRKKLKKARKKIYRGKISKDATYFEIFGRTLYRRLK